MNKLEITTNTKIKNSIIYIKIYRKALKIKQKMMTIPIKYHKKYNNKNKFLNKNKIIALITQIIIQCRKMKTKTIINYLLNLIRNQIY